MAKTLDVHPNSGPKDGACRLAYTPHNHSLFSRFP